MLSGVINLDKPPGLTSREAVNRISRSVGERKAGHAGTLDPAATGVLLVCLGRATRISSFLMDLPKQYDAVMRLGENTDTQDAEGRVIERRDISHLVPDDVRNVIGEFLGDIQQIPPMYSAMKRNGVALHKLARAGKTVEREPRTVSVHGIDLHEISLPEVAFSVTCSKGTYVRTLCEDIGMRLGVGGHLARLRRTAVGPFRIGDACSLEESSAQEVIPLDAALSFMPLFTVGERWGRLLLNGHALPRAAYPEAAAVADGTRVRLAHPDRGIVGVGTTAGPEVKVKMLLTTWQPASTGS